MMNRSLGATLDRMLVLNRALDEAVAGPRVDQRGRTWVPALDVTERADAYRIDVDLPGVSPDAVQVDFEQHVLTIRGTKPAAFTPDADEEYRLHARERVVGDFERALRLPATVDAERIAAEFRDGVLSVTVPKAQAARARRIAVRTGTGTAPERLTGEDAPTA